MSNYKRGRRSEHYIADMLRDRGFTVTRAAGSHSPFDLVAYTPSECWHIQVKKRARIADVELLWRELAALTPPHCKAWVVIKQRERWVWYDGIGFAPYDEGGGGAK